jgi:hypothetical protein
LISQAFSAFRGVRASGFESNEKAAGHAAFSFSRHGKPVLLMG